MSDYRIFDVEVVVSKMVRVKVPTNDPEVVRHYETIEAVAREFALGGKSSWPEWVISEAEEHEVESVREIISPENNGGKDGSQPNTTDA